MLAGSGHCHGREADVSIGFFSQGGQNEVAQIRGVFLIFTPPNLVFKAPQAPYAKMGALSRRSAATDGEKYLILRTGP